MIPPLKKWRTFGGGIDHPDKNSYEHAEGATTYTIYPVKFGYEIRLHPALQGLHAWLGAEGAEHGQPTHVFSGPAQGVTIAKKHAKARDKTLRAAGDYHALLRDGNEIMRGTSFDVAAYIHKHHSYSLDHALKYEGYSMVRIGKTAVAKQFGTSGESRDEAERWARQENRRTKGRTVSKAEEKDRRFCLSSGYAYQMYDEADRKRENTWKTSKDDNWEIIMRGGHGGVTEAPMHYLGKRRIDGAEVVVLRTAPWPGGVVFAQTTIHVRRC